MYILNLSKYVLHFHRLFLGNQLQSVAIRSLSWFYLGCWDPFSLLLPISLDIEEQEAPTHLGLFGPFLDLLNLLLFAKRTVLVH